MNSDNDLDIADVVLPAINGTLQSLGYSIDELKEKSLGIVLADMGKRAWVHFPELNLSIWLEKSELANVVKMSELGNVEYTQLLPKGSVNQYAMVWLLRFILNELPVVEVLEIEHGLLENVWDEDEIYSATGQQFATRFGVGIENTSPDKISEIKFKLGDRLMDLRFHPAGMHKFEARFYLRALKAI